MFQDVQKSELTACKVNCLNILNFQMKNIIQQTLQVFSLQFLKLRS